MIHSSTLGLADGHTFTHTDKRRTFLLQRSGRLALVCGTRWTIYRDVHGMEAERSGLAESFEESVTAVFALLG